MGRLKALTPRLTGLRPRLARAEGRVALDQARADHPGRRWYWTARWKRLRLAVFARDLFTCQWPGCGKLEGDTSRLIADHRTPHCGDVDLFWDEANVWTLCPSCHSSAKQRAERADG